MTPGLLNMTRSAWLSWDLLTGSSFLSDLTAGTCTGASGAEEWDIYGAADSARLHVEHAAHVSALLLMANPSR